MKIALFCTNEFSIPVKDGIIYAPIPLFFSLAEELAERGNKVFVYASSDSEFKNKNIKVISKDLISFEKACYKNMWGSFHDQEVVTIYEQFLMSQIIEDQRKYNFDIIHIYHQIIHFLPFIKFAEVPVVATLHDPINDKRSFLLEKSSDKNKVNYVSISNNQRKAFPSLNFIQTIHNGLDEKKYEYTEKPKDYFVFLGRLSPEKGVHNAIEAAIKAGVKLKIIGPKWDNDYWKNKIEPFIGERIEYLGPMNHQEAVSAVSKAKGLLFPIEWEEPFGLVMIEAMAGGVPVIGFNKGSVSEVIEDNKTGFIVNSVEEMTEAIKKIDNIKREDCRKKVEEKFTLKRMADQYEKVYKKLRN